MGESIEEGETLVEIETDKVMMEVPASVSGVLAKQIKHEGDTVMSNEAVAEVTQGAVAAVANVADQTQVENSVENVEQGSLSPAVRRAAKANDVNVANVSGTGKNGRITKQDVLSSKAQPAQAKPAASAASEG